MEFSFKLKIGALEVTFSDVAKNSKEFFEKVSFYSDLPTKGPNGEEDLKIVHRTTSKGYEYYSIVSESAKQEFKFGQTRDADSLYPKGWHPMYSNSEESEEEVIETKPAVKSSTPTPTAKPALNKPSLPAKPAAKTETSESVKNVLSKYGITK